MRIAELVKFRRGLARGGALAAAGALAALIAGGALAAEPGIAVPGQIGFQKAVTPIAAEIHWFHDDLLMPIISLISLLVLVLLGYVVWKFNEKANPVPSKTTHNTMIEVLWTI